MKRIITILLTCCMVMYMLPLSVFALEAAEPIEISSCEDFNNIRNNLNGDYILAQNLDFSTWGNWEPIGQKEVPFTGTFDGNGYVISNLTIELDKNSAENEADYFASVFGYVSGGEIINFGVNNTSIKLNYDGSYYSNEEEILANAGGIVGLIKDGTISNCFFTGDVVVLATGNAFARAGGIAAAGINSTISNCYSNAQIYATAEYANTMVAGIVAWLDGTNVSNCYAAGTVEGLNENGYCYAGGIHSSANTSSIWGIIISYGGTVRNCAVLLNEIKADGTTNIVEDIGYASEQYNNIRIASNSAEAWEQSTYESLGWDFDSIWYMQSEQYPLLLIFKNNAISGKKYLAIDINNTGKSYFVGDEIRFFIYDCTETEDDYLLWTKPKGLVIQVNDDEKISLKKCVEYDDFTECIFVADAPGVVTVSISDDLTSEPINVTLNITVDEYASFRADKVPTYEYDIIIDKDFYNAYVNGMYVTDFTYRSISDDLYTFDFTVYNETYAPGVVEVYNADGTIRKIEIIGKFSDPSSLQSVVIGGKDMIVDMWNGDTFSFRGVSASKETRISVDVPQDGYVIVTNSCVISPVCLYVNLLDVYLTGAGLINSTLNFSLETNDNIKNEIIKAIFSSDISKKAVVEMQKQFLEDFGAELVDNSVSTIFGIATDNVNLMLDTFEIDLEEIMVNAGVGTAFSAFQGILQKGGGPAGEALALIFYVQKYLNFQLQVNQFINNTNNKVGWAVVTPASNTDGVTEITSKDGVTVESEEKLPSETILQVYRIVDYSNETDGLDIQENDNYTLYDISLIHNGQEMQPKKPVTVYIPVPEGYEQSSIRVYKQDQYGNWKFVEIAIYNGMIVFEIDHFCLFAIIDDSKDDSCTEYTVTFNPNGGTISLNTLTTNFDGKLISFPISTRNGYTFDGWYTDPVGGTKITTSTVFTSNTTVYAHWTIESSTYTVTYTDGVDGEEVFADQTFDVEKGSSTPAFIGTPTRSGYTFTGWNPAVSATVTDNQVYTATWVADAPIKYAVTVNGSYTSITGAGEYETGAAVTISAGTRSGYTFAGWTSSDVNITNKYSNTTTFTMPATDVTVTANWTKDSTGGVIIPTEFSINIKDSNNGKVEASVKYAVPGSTVKLTVTPDEGYELDTLSVKSDRKEIDVTEKNGKYQFTMPYGSVNVTATFKAVNPYNDVDTDDWFYDDVLLVTAKELMEGTGNSKFSPDISADRAMIVTILWRQEGCPVVDSPVDFDDVADGLWYSEAIDWASSNGIVNGYGDGNYGPTNQITREQIMAILNRYAVYKNWTDDIALPMIPQYNCSTWAENNVIWADMSGLLNGLGVDITDMTAKASRAELAAYLSRFVQNVVK